MFSCDRYKDRNAALADLSWVYALLRIRELCYTIRMSDNQELSLFEQIGGEAQIKALVDRFYFHMDTIPEVKGIRDMHPKSLDSSNEKLYEFLCGWTGGPQLYIEKHGHPRLRARHLPFKIGIPERDQWLLCFFKALEDCQIAEGPKKILMSSIGRLADHMRNQA